MKAVIYARYSSHNQKEESIDGQLRECHDFAKKTGLTVIGEYCDRALSGKTDKRPQFQKLIKDSEKGRFDAVILYTIDRFARNRYDSAIYKAKLKKNGVKLFYAKQPLPDTPEGIILESVLEGYAEYYSENLARGVKRGMHEKALQCVALGKAPFGYKIGLDKHFEIDPIEAQVVRLVFDMCVDGKSHKEIFTHITEKGYKNSRGGKIGYSTIAKILSNDRYTGIYRHDDVVIEGGMPAIIDKHTFSHVQSIIGKNKTGRARNKTKTEYLLSGKLFCGHCKEPMVGESGRARNGDVHYYYKCRGRKKEHNCNKKTERKEWIEKLVAEKLVEVILTDKNINKIVDRAMELLHKESNNNTALNALNETLKDVNDKLHNIVHAIENGIFSDSTQGRLTELENLKNETLMKIDELQDTFPQFERQELLVYIKSFRNGDVRDISFQRKLIDMFVHSIYVYDTSPKKRKVVITCNMGDNKTISFDSDLDPELHQYMLCSNIFVTARGFGIIVIKKEVD